MKRLAAVFSLLRLPFWKKRFWKRKCYWKSKIIVNARENNSLQEVLTLAKQVVDLYTPDGALAINTEKLTRVLNTVAGQTSASQSQWPPGLIHAVSTMADLSLSRVCYMHETQKFDSVGEAIAYWHDHLSAGLMRTSKKAMKRQRSCSMLLAILVSVACGSNVSRYQLSMLRDLLFGDHAKLWLHTHYYDSVQWAELDPAEAV